MKEDDWGERKKGRMKMKQRGKFVGKERKGKDRKAKDCREAIPSKVSLC